MAAETDAQLYLLTEQARRYVRELTAASNWITPGWHPAEYVAMDTLQLRVCFSILLSRKHDAELVEVLMDLGRYHYK